MVASTGKRGASTGSKTQSTQQEAQAPSQSSGRSIRDYYQPKAITTKQAATAGIAPASQSPRAGSEASTGTVSYHSASTGQAQTPLRPIKAVRDDVGAGYAAHESPRAASSGVSSVTATPAPTRRPVASTGAQPTLPQAAPLLAHTGDVLATPGKRTLRGPKAPHAAPAPASDADVAPRGSGAASAAAAVAAAGVLAVGTLQPLSAAAASSMATQPPQYSGPSMEIMSTPQPYRTHMALQGVQQAVAPPLRAYGEDKLGGSLQSHQIDVTPTTGPVRRMAQANNMQTSPMVPSPGRLLGRTTVTLHYTKHTRMPTCTAPVRRTCTGCVLACSDPCARDFHMRVTAGLGLVTASPSLPTLEVSDSPIITLPPSRMAPTRPIDPYSAFTAQPLPPTEPKKKSKNILRSSLKGIMKLLDRAKKNKGGGATPGQQGEHTTAPTTTTTTAITVPRIQYTPVTAPTDVNSSNSNVTVPRVQYSPAAVGTHNGEIDSATRVTVPRVQYTPVTVPYVESPAQTVRTGTQTMGQSPVASPMWQGDDDDEHRGAIRPASPGRATSGASGGLVPQSPVSAAATSPPPQPAPAAAAVGRVKRPPRPAALPASAPPAGTDVIDLLSDNEDDNTNTIIITTNTNTNNTNSTNSTSDASANKGVSFLSSKRGKGKGRDKAAQKGKDGLGGRMRRSVSDFANSVKTKVRSVLARDREGEGRGEGDDNTNMPHPEIAVLKAADFRTLRTRLRENTPNNHDRCVCVCVCVCACVCMPLFPFLCVRARCVCVRTAMRMPMSWPCLSHFSPVQACLSSRMHSGWRVTMRVCVCVCLVHRFFPGWTPWIMISGRNPRAVKDDVPPLPGVYEWGVLVPGRPRDEPIAFYLGKAGEPYTLAPLPRTHMTRRHAL